MTPRHVRSPRANGATKLLCAAALALAPLAAQGAGKPPPTYPERFDAPTDTTEREARCAELREREGPLQRSMGTTGVLSRLDIVRVYLRSSQRYLEEQCGDVDANGNALSHVAERSGRIKGSPAPSAHGHEGGEHGGELEGGAHGGEHGEAAHHEG